MNKPAEKMMTMEEIERRALEFSETREYLARAVTALNQELDRVKAEYLQDIRSRVKEAATTREELREAIAEAPELFDKPRTRVLAGVKVGYTKQRGKVEFDDEAAVIRRIREKFPEEQAELLIRVRESVHKPALYDLVASDLKRLGVRITDDEDVVVIKPTDSEVDKLVDALLADAERIEGAE